MMTMLGRVAFAVPSEKASSEKTAIGKILMSVSVGPFVSQVLAMHQKIATNLTEVDIMTGHFPSCYGIYQHLSGRADNVERGTPAANCSGRRSLTFLS